MHRGAPASVLVLTEQQLALFQDQETQVVVGFDKETPGSNLLFLILAPEPFHHTPDLPPNVRLLNIAAADWNDSFDTTHWERVAGMSLNVNQELLTVITEDVNVSSEVEHARDFNRLSPAFRDGMAWLVDPLNRAKADGIVSAVTSRP